MTLTRSHVTFVRTAFATALLPLFAACAVGPEYKAPAATTATRITAQPLPAETAATPVLGGESQRLVEGGVLPARWWTLFGNATLDGWVDEAIRNSPSLDAAEATLKQAEASYRAATGSLYPSVSASTGASRNKISGAGSGGGFPGSIFNLYDAGVQVSYSLDLWGAVQTGIAGQQALVDAERRQSQAAYLTLAGNVVTSAIALASAETQLKTARDIVTAYDDTLALVQRRLELGAGTRAEVIAFSSRQAQARANVPPLERERSRASHQLAVLLGRLPSEFDAGRFTLDALTLPRELPVSLPSALVAQRPDIAVAETRLRVASANVGIAEANRLPQLTLSAQVGTQASRVEDLFKEDIWSLAANLAAPLFDGGRLKAERDASVAAYAAAEAGYRLAVLEAFREVADALSAVEIDARALQAQHQAYQLALENLAITEKRFKAGAANTLEVRDAKLSAAQSQMLFVQAQAARHADTAALFTALGGALPDTATAVTAAPAAAPAAP